MVRLASIIVIVLSLCSYALSAGNVYIEKNKMFVDGVEFIMKGIDYSPAPIGRSSMASSGFGGTGLCSPKMTPWGEWKSACYDSDYFDGSTDLDPTRFPTGFRPLWERDFPYIKAIGSNTIRIYNTNPSTKAATQQYKNLFPYATGKDHTQFMEFCRLNGIYVIYPLYSDNGAFDNTKEVEFKRYLRWQIDEVGNSSALLMWQLGNEMAWTWGRDARWNNITVMDKFNRYADYIRRYTLSKWGRVVPITTAVINAPADFPYQVQNFHVDVFSSNVFGDSFPTLFTGTSTVTGMTKLVCTYNKGFLMSEIGHTAAPHQPYTTGNINQIWYNVVKNIPNGLMGALYFEQTDEPAIGKDFGLFSLAVTKDSVTGKNSTQVDAFIADTLVTKQQYYDAKSGTYSGKAYNINSNIFTLLNRSPYTLSTVPDFCTSVGTFKACPGSGNPKCSGNGVCDRSVGKCTCAGGWSGSDCSVAVCPSSCSGRGYCSSIVTPPECFCNDGYYGPSCSSTTASVNATLGQCPGGCSAGNGVCNSVTGLCQCWPGWIGADCSVHDFGYGSVTIQQHYSNCLVDSPTNRDFAVQAPNSTSLTNQKCRYYCALRNYTYSGTQSGNQCWCDNVVGGQGTSSSCTSNCVGDSRQMCGGVNRNTAYRAGSLAATGYKGCFVDNTTSPDFAVQAYNSTTVNSSTIDQCRQTCNNQKFAYAALQNGDTCSCGNAYGKYGKVDDVQCSSPCTGDSTIKCGGPLLNSVYISALPSGYAFY